MQDNGSTLELRVMHLEGVTRTLQKEQGATIADLRSLREHVSQIRKLQGKLEAAIMKLDNVMRIALGDKE